MKGIISTNKNDLELINKKINDAMKLKIKNYSAFQWGEIRKHPTEEKFVLIIDDDSRNPTQFLNSENKLKLLTINEFEWFPNQ